MILFFNVSSADSGKKSKRPGQLPYNQTVVMEAIKEITHQIGKVKCPVHSRSVGLVTFTFKEEKLTYLVSTCCSMVGPVLELYLAGSTHPYRLFFRSENDAWKWN